jgi:thiamine pyrophosphate-dependent acetolactate synthase large subunit-like protein
MSAYGHSTAVDLSSPDFEQLAAAYGVSYRLIAGTADAGAALREALAGLSQGCWLIELQAELQAPPQSL